MTAAPSKVQDYSWEKEFAPKISSAYFWFVAALYVTWMGFLAFVAANRWFGTLQ